MPPVMIVICHDTNVARMIDHHIAVLGEASPDLVNPPRARRSPCASTPTPWTKPSPASATQLPRRSASWSPPSASRESRAPRSAA